MTKKLKHKGEDITVHYNIEHQTTLFGPDEKVYTIHKVTDKNGVDIDDLTEKNIKTIQKLLPLIK